MGNEISTEPFEGPPEVLESRDISGLAHYIKSKRCQNVFFMVGAGVSTAAGIPDFRSPKTGLYANLARLNLPYPEAVFEINFFRDNPAPFYTLAKELDPARYRPTLSHAFIRLFSAPPQTEGSCRLHTCFTQNIDTLERRAGVPGEVIIEAHGSFADQHCIDCRARFDSQRMREHIQRSEFAKCDSCGGLVKPDIVFFGEALPEAFHKAVPNLTQADLLIIMGTSLKVNPFAALTRYVPERCPRVLINMEEAGDIGTRSDDVFLQGKCDEVVRELCQELGPEWEQELDKLHAETALVVNDSTGTATEEVANPTSVEDEVERITDRIGKAMNLSTGGSTEAIDHHDRAEQNAKAAEDNPKNPKEGVDDRDGGAGTQDSESKSSTEAELTLGDDAYLLTAIDGTLPKGNVGEHRADREKEEAIVPGDGNGGKL